MTALLARPPRPLVTMAEERRLLFFTVEYPDGRQFVVRFTAAPTGWALADGDDAVVAAFRRIGSGEVHWMPEPDRATGDRVLDAVATYDLPPGLAWADAACDAIVRVA